MCKEHFALQACSVHLSFQETGRLVVETGVATVIFGFQGDTADPATAATLRYPWTKDISIDSIAR